MLIGNTQRSYGLVTQLVHWGTVFLIAWLFWLGFTMTDLPLSPEKFEVYALHKSLGLTVLTVAVLRLIWRHLFPRPAFEGEMSGFERIAAHVSHIGFYLLMLAIPLTGWMYSSATAIPVSWFGLITLPNLVGASEPLAKTLEQTHELLGYLLLALIALHVAGALKHHFVGRDRTLMRMIVPASGKES